MPKQIDYRSSRTAKEKRRIKVQSTTQKLRTERNFLILKGRKKNVLIPLNRNVEVMQDNDWHTV